VDDYVLAQVNIGRLVAPIDSPLIAGFAAALDEVNAVADAAGPTAQAFTLRQHFPPPQSGRRRSRVASR
jgi:hypothetical protein